MASSTLSLRTAEHWNQRARHAHCILKSLADTEATPPRCEIDVTLSKTKCSSASHQPSRVRLRLYFFRVSRSTACAVPLPHPIANLNKYSGRAVSETCSTVCKFRPDLCLAHPRLPSI